MTRQELENQYLVVDGITFTPRYDCTEIESEDGEVVKDFDYTITATAQEVYQEWLVQQNVEPPKTDIEILQEENILLKAQVNALATNQEFLEDCLIEVGQVIYA